jgi:hypothetical protein
MSVTGGRKTEREGMAHVGEHNTLFGKGWPGIRADCENVYDKLNTSR